MATTQAQRTAVRKAAEFVKRTKGAISTAKARELAAQGVGKAYDLEDALARLVLAEKAQKVANRVSAAIREGRLDANNMDRTKLRALLSESLADYQANLLMRNALSTAYNAGYYEQGIKDNTKAYWLYETRRDGSVRPEHARWEGLLLLKSDPLARQIFPPNGHNCRCRMRAVSRKEARALLAAGRATATKPDVVKKVYQDRRTGEAIETIEGVDPGWMGLPGSSPEAYAALLKRALARLDASL